MTAPTPKVSIDCFPESVARYGTDVAIVTVDVFRATTTAITAVDLGRRCYPVASVEEAHALAPTLPNPILAGELSGVVPDGFDLANSPVELAGLGDTARPVILLTTSGARLMCAAGGSHTTYVASLRNWSSTVAHLVGRHADIAVIGAGSRGEFRDEDQLCCAWITEGLIRAGYHSANEDTSDAVGRWAGADVSVLQQSKSAEFLRQSGHETDIDFVLDHIDDLDAVFGLRAGEVVVVDGLSPAG